MGSIRYRSERPVSDELAATPAASLFGVSKAASGRLHPGTTGSYLAPELNGGNSASNSKESPRTACPLETVEESGSRPWPENMMAVKLTARLNVCYDYC
jgi:hypothetical protein